MRMFWSKGYQETSYDDLVRATGVGRKSLYATFGDKWSLYLASLRRYRATVVPHLFCALDDDEASVESIRTMFRGFVELASSPRGRNGCFLTKTSADNTIADREVNKIVTDHWDKLQSQFYDALSRSGIPSGRSRRLSHYFVGVTQGLLTMANAGAGRKHIAPFIEEALLSLD